ncbi:MAG: hypothetical protein B6244_11040 [Candidatus Cloacimonetes bacterium 4572_55]|nr:MAG: hypothetical protein B6244_11040 [Candidatus Cloacimonetes bacterium 4572_55]
MFKLKELINYSPPIILFYGEKKKLDRDMRSIVKQTGSHIRYVTIDTDTSCYYHLLSGIVAGLGGDAESVQVASQWQSAVLQADHRSAGYGKETSSYRRIWNETFAKEAALIFLQFIKKTSVKQPAVVLLDRFEEIDYSFQRLLEKYLAPILSDVKNFKLILFYEGNSKPSWKTYDFDRYTHPISRVNRNLKNFVNPYIAGRPVRIKGGKKSSPIFVGRKPAIDFFIERLMQSDSPPLMGMRGERRIGKTSLLMNMECYISDDYLPILIDLQMIESPERTENGVADLIEKFGFEIAQRLRYHYHLEIQEPKKEEFRKNPAQVFSHFLNDIVSQIGDKKLLLLFDEFDRVEDWVIKGLLQLDFLPIFKKLILNNRGIVGIVSYTNRLTDLREEKSYWREFLSDIDAFHLTTFDEDAALELIQQPVDGVIDYSEEALDAILAYSGQHPYFIQLICWILVNRGHRISRSNLTEKDVALAAQEAIIRGEAQLNFMYETACKPKEREVIKKVVFSTESHKESYPVERLDKSLSGAVESLISRGILRKEHPNIFFRIGLIDLWVRKNFTAF